MSSSEPPKQPKLPLKYPLDPLRKRKSRTVTRCVRRIGKLTSELYWKLSELRDAHTTKICSDIRQRAKRTLWSAFSDCVENEWSEICGIQKELLDIHQKLDDCWGHMSSAMLYEVYDIYAEELNRLSEKEKNGEQIDWETYRALTRVMQKFGLVPYESGK